MLTSFFWQTCRKVLSISEAKYIDEKGHWILSLFISEKKIFLLVLEIDLAMPAEQCPAVGVHEYSLKVDS